MTKWTMTDAVAAAVALRKPIDMEPYYVSPANGNECPCFACRTITRLQGWHVRLECVFVEDEMRTKPYWKVTYRICWRPTKRWAQRVADKLNREFSNGIDSTEVDGG